MQGAVRASSVASGSLLENLANRFYVGEQRVTHKFQAFDRSLRSFAVPGAASISDNHGNVTKVGSVPHCWFDSDLHRHADDDEGINTTISQGEVEPCAFEGRHGQFVENTF